MALKIAIVGVVGDSASTNWDQLWSIDGLGHIPIGIDYREIAERSGTQEKAEDALLDSILSEEPDMVIFSKFNGWHTEVIKKVKEAGIVTWYWFMDPLAFLTRSLIEHAITADFASATGRAQADLLRQYGANAYWIREGYNYHKYRPTKPKVDIGERKEFDVVFIGQKTADRVNIFNEINKQGHKVASFGSGWEQAQTINSEQFRYLCANSELLLGRDREKFTYGYCSDRAYRVMACAGAYISVAPPGMEKWLRDGDNCLLAKDDTDLIEKINNVLDDPQAFDLRGIRDRAQISAIIEHCWDYRIKEMLDILKENKVFKKEKFNRLKREFTNDFLEQFAKMTERFDTLVEDGTGIFTD